MGLFGRTLAGLRIFSAIIGTLTIPAMYLLARHLFNVRIGLIAAFLLATFPPHIQFSRLGLNNIADPLVGTLALGFLTRGFKSGQRLDYVLGGVMLGLTQHFYEGGRLLFPVLAVIWIAGIAATRRVDWAGIGLFGVAAVLTSAPLMWAWASTGLTFLPRTDRSADLRLPLIPRIGRALLTYIHVPEPLVCIHYYGGHTALILPGMIPLFLSGLFYALKGSFARKPGLWLLLLWPLLIALGNSFISEPSMYTRYVTTFPALVLVMALGMDVVLPRVLRAIRAVSHMTLVVSILIVLAGSGQVVYYFGWHLPRFTTQFWEAIIARDIDDAIFRGVDFPASTQVLFVPAYPFDWVVTQEKLNFLGLEWSFSSIQSSELTPEYLRDMQRDVDHAFFIESGDEDTRALLASQFDLEGPEYTSSIPESERYDLYYYHAPKDD